MRKLNSRRQRTLSQSVEIRGVGFLTGANVCLRFVPAPPNTGVVFVRTDLHPHVEIPARVEQITGSSRRTTLGYMPRSVSLVEHVLAALAGLRVDNCYVELNALEPPGLDGSAQPFTELLVKAGIEVQSAERAVWTVDAPIVVSRAGATLALHPHRDGELRISYLLDYGPFSPIVPQRYTRAITPIAFLNDLARCRTFLLEDEAEELRRQGIGSRTRINDIVVFAPAGPVENRLRYGDEPARHKVLDIVGDLSLLGFDLQGHIVAYRSGHSLNAALAREICQRLEPRLPARRRAA